MRFINAEELATHFNYEEFIPRLKADFCGNFTVPNRHHYDYGNGQGERESTLLIMPAWEDGEFVGIKTVTVSPYNGQFELPSIQGIYTLINAKDGTVKAQIDAKALTVKRTATTSALASSYLARADASTLLMVGTGALAPELIQAHASVRPIQKVLIWGRNRQKAELLQSQLADSPFEVMVAASIEEGMQEADIISVATLSQEPLVLGQWLRPGQHLDLVGSYRPDMRETDDEALKKTSVYIDHEGALKESGDLAIPLANGVIDKEEIRATLFELCQQDEAVRSDSEEITLFKSVGHALEDLSAAKYILATVDT